MIRHVAMREPFFEITALGTTLVLSENGNELKAFERTESGPEEGSC